MQYQEALEWLLVRPKITLEKGVARVQWLLKQLQHPERAVPAVHFVGTNGKGSTLNALQSILMSAGYRVGRFTSPSILEYREQIVYQSEMISEEDFAKIMMDVIPLVLRLPSETVLGEASEFEVLVVVFFVYMTSYQSVDIVLVEAGMGGVLDATNVLSPLAVVCPSIGLDHQSFLGTTHVEIARQKMGVLRKRVPLVYASQRSDVLEVCEAQAWKLASPTYALGREFHVYQGKDCFEYRSHSLSLTGLKLGMRGKHQYNNAAVAIQTAELLVENFPRIDEVVIRQGLVEARWPGRIEFVRENVVIDGAHNNESVAVLCQFLTETYANHAIYILFAAINTKPVDTMLEQLENVGQVTVTTFEDERAVPIEVYQERYATTSSFIDWLEGVDYFAPCNLYVITGSLYFISDVRKYLLAQME